MIANVTRTLCRVTVICVDLVGRVSCVRVSGGSGTSWEMGVRAKGNVIKLTALNEQQEAKTLSYLSP